MKTADPVMYQNILVPVDGSPFAEHALPLALGLVRRSGAVLHVIRVHVSMVPLYGSGRYGMIADAELDRIARLQEQDYLEQLVRRLPAAPNVRVSTTFVDGSISDAIEQHAESVDADLVVMSTHGYGPLSRFWLGSVADRLVRQLPRPMLLVRPQEKLPDFSGEPVFKRLLLPLDGTPEAERIIEPAVALGRLMQADFVLLQSIAPVLITAGPALPWGINMGPVQTEQFQALQAENEAKAQAYLHTIAERLRSQSLHVETQVTVCEQPATAILDGVQQQAIDLIALETHGRHGLERMFLGSVADKIIRGATTPVLLHRSPPAAPRTPA